MNPAFKLDIIIPDDHRLELDLPGDLPVGPAELIVRPVPRREIEEPPGAPRTDPPKNLAELFANHIGLVDSRSSENDTESDVESFVDHLEEKRRTGHL